MLRRRIGIIFCLVSVGVLLLMNVFPYDVFGERLRDPAFSHFLTGFRLLSLLALGSLLWGLWRLYQAKRNGLDDLK